MVWRPLVHDTSSDTCGSVFAKRLRPLVPKQPPIPQNAPDTPLTEKSPKFKPGYQPRDLSVSCGILGLLSRLLYAKARLTPRRVVLIRVGVNTCCRLRTPFILLEGEAILFSA